MQLSNEDNLRLNVLLAQPLQAVRINESTMTVHALTEKGEAKVRLNPTVRDEQYLRWVRELLSMKVTGSPGGYPVFLKRWTRMGHARNNLEQMLLLGEPEAVVAVVHTPNISHETGRRAWWANPSAHNARRLLEKPDVVAGPLGKELAAYLLEFLPFEEMQLDVVDTVRLCLQGELIVREEREKLWNRAKRKNPFYVGFMHADPALIPLPAKPNPQHAAINLQLVELLAAGNPFAQTLCRILDSNGQNWLKTLQLALDKPVDQDVVISLFVAINRYFALPFPEFRGVRETDTAQQRAEQYCSGNCLTEAKAVVDALDNSTLPLFKAMLILAQTGEDSLIPYFGGNDSVGSVMRNRIKPLTELVLTQTRSLLGKQVT
ncbi:MAG TPA: hypothetical protein PLE99_04605 [Candidatus Thiothrix moscowensis]|uniref:hypothetical protein n=1 Tax=unclassified Thiothrix TaxID=2636184 RepID=UPI0025DB447E|nr:MULTISPECIES: hypothetical protein [unclassified Thiothrix]HRJ52029.1 hypothetical protein [Candidatus Thiothrix moscowensis]HRJ92460.1 hypothetical protein [Candidatus Thiothrix moscowensis]